MKIAIYGRFFNPGFKQYVDELFDTLSANKVVVYIYNDFYQYLISDVGCKPIACEIFTSPADAPADIDFLVSIGGDGTFLESIAYLQSFNIPVVGLNSGRLGFLANISKEEISKAFDALLNKNYVVEERSLLTIQSTSDNFSNKNFSLNDVAIQKEDSVMITIDAFLNNEYLNTYWTDGLIIATPTGSTAYSLSVGGPIVTPGAGNFIIAPIASHNLTVRPIVVSDSVSIRLKVNSRSGKFLVTLDNRTELFDSKNNEFTIRKADFSLKMLQLPFNNYYSTLRSKLMWGADKRN